MKASRVMTATVAVLGLWLVGAWAAEPAGSAKAQPAKPGIQQALKAMRIGRLELMRERIGLQLLREKGAPQKQIGAAQRRVKALQEKQQERWRTLRAKHPQAARRLAMMGTANANRRMAPGRSGAPQRGMMGRGMAFGMDRARPGAMGWRQDRDGRAGMSPRGGWARPQGMRGWQQPGPMAPQRRPMGPAVAPDGPRGAPRRLRAGMHPEPAPQPEPGPNE